MTGSRWLRNFFLARRLLTRPTITTRCGRSWRRRQIDDSTAKKRPDEGAVQRNGALLGRSIWLFRCRSRLPPLHRWEIAGKAEREEFQKFHDSNGDGVIDLKSELLGHSQNQEA